MKKHQTTFRFTEQERETLQKIREYYGVTTDIDAIRIALKETGRMIEQLSPPKPQIRNAHSSGSQLDSSKSSWGPIHPPLKRRGLSGPLL